MREKIEFDMNFISDIAVTAMEAGNNGKIKKTFIKFDSLETTFELEKSLLIKFLVVISRFFVDLVHSNV